MLSVPPCFSEQGNALWALTGWGTVALTPPTPGQGVWLTQAPPTLLRR